MTRSIALLACTAAFTLAACAPLPPANGRMPPAGACNAEAAHWAIGRAATPDVVERIRVDTGSGQLRVIHPGQPVTMDYRAGRVNIQVNERNAITTISCG